jgi:uncharacterized membrane protein
MRREILICVSLILVMLVTGVFWGTWFTLTRSIDTFSAKSFIQIGKTIIGNVAWPMRILMPATLLSLLWLCLETRRTGVAWFLFVSALILMLITLLITVMIEVPIDNQIVTWKADALPGDWVVLRERWSKFHLYRTITSVLSFVSLSIGSVNAVRN